MVVSWLVPTVSCLATLMTVETLAFNTLFPLFTVFPVEPRGIAWPCNFLPSFVVYLFIRLTVQRHFLCADCQALLLVLFASEGHFV